MVQIFLDHLSAYLAARIYRLALSMIKNDSKEMSPTNVTQACHREESLDRNSFEFMRNSKEKRKRQKKIKEPMNQSKGTIIDKN